LLIVVGLLTWTFAGYEFPNEFSGRSDLVYWVAGIATTTTFFACLLAHEMGHAIVAGRLKVRVEGITLWLFGGIARIRGDDMTAESELRIAIAGPIVSLVLAGFFVGVSWLIPNSGPLEMVGGVAGWLGRINAMLALFNLIPAFPMDGGRILRAYLWKRKGRIRATAFATKTGKGFGLLLMGLGFFEIGVGDPAGGAWLIFLGWFLSTAARSEEIPVSLRQPLGDLKVGDVMTPSPVTAPAWMTIDAFLQFAGGQPYSAYPLRDIDGTIAGLAIVQSLARFTPRDRARIRAREVACSLQDVSVARPEDLLEQALERPGRCAPGYLIVLNDEGLVGLVTPEDIKRADTSAKERRKSEDGADSAEDRAEPRSA
ncbi:MAG TPA: site-2 protease family protein, partial [Actinomycetota bacterium]|nr:site-2 protease family protein [Actinomycetota bacterium]